jgi:hypothetical protein
MPQNLGGADFVLTTDGLEGIEAAAKLVLIAGRHYPEVFLNMSGR